MSSLSPTQTFDELLLSRQVVFQEPGDNGLLPPMDVNSDQWATHLAHISSREPSNLLNHVRRIYLHLEHKQSDPLYGAMVDLYLTLGEKGERLRHNLLQQAKKLISQEQYDLFYSHQEQGLKSHQALPASQYSVLGNFFSSEKRLVIEHKVEQAPAERETDPLELAREELNYGDITVAQQILEEAVLQTPKRLGLHYSLLEVYKHTRSLDDLLSMKERLGDSIGSAQSAWSQMQKALERTSS